jgi:predicted RNase H-related nuclease YkuK (DUF458 family)
MSKTLVFRKFDGTLIEDVNAYVQDWVTKNPYGQIIVGCDSQEHSRYVKYAIVIVMHYKDKYGMGKGAHVIKSIIAEAKPKKTYVQRNGKKSFDTSSLQNKLWEEVELTIQAANMLKGCEKKITIHVDYNSESSAVSNVLYAPGIGYAQGMGYEAKGKPWAWASTHVADSLCR